MTGPCAARGDAGGEAGGEAGVNLDDFYQPDPPTTLSSPAVTDQVVAETKINGLDYDVLANNEMLMNDLRSSLQNSFATKAEVDPSQVDIQLSAGSVKVRVKISAEQGAALPDVKVPDAQTIIQLVKEVQGIVAAVSAGKSLEDLVVKEPAVFQVRAGQTAFKRIDDGLVRCDDNSEALKELQTARGMSVAPCSNSTVVDQCADDEVRSHCPFSCGECSKPCYDDDWDLGDELGL
jgi:hypothetical protein